ncbi:MAG TPA: response regulator transcription factor [Terriglobales bacterium]|nr:response regulator transcription factor [Terriglobales bacterium]
MPADSMTLPENDREIATMRVLVADDSKPLRDAVRRLVAGYPSWEVCGEAINGRDAIEKAMLLRPEVILMDVGMPEVDGLEATRRIRELLPEVEILIFTQYDSEQAWREAVAAGARGYLAKAKASCLIEALEAVSQHQEYSSHTSRV